MGFLSYVIPRRIVTRKVRQHTAGAGMLFLHLGNYLHLVIGYICLTIPVMLLENCLKGRFELSILFMLSALFCLGLGWLGGAEYS